MIGRSITLPVSGKVDAPATGAGNEVGALNIGQRCDDGFKLLELFEVASSDDPFGISNMRWNSSATLLGNRMTSIWLAA